MNKQHFNSIDYRIEEMRLNLNKAGFRPLDVMFTGVTGAGKSTSLNALFHKKIAKVGYGCDPMTMTLDHYKLHGELRFWDTPGLGDGIESDKKHSKKLIELLHKTYPMQGNTYGFIDMVVIVIEGSNRDMGSTYQLINDVILANIEPERVVIAINKADVAKKGRGWDDTKGEPTSSLHEFLEEQACSIQSRIKSACGIEVKRPIFYSADKGFNLDVFMDAIINAMPEVRRNLMLHIA
ncbi:GTPase [Psychromonas sp. SA13A]|uniref:GTPase family protein n=1 Tax=Psychromonas sp. SA13A TaxID=2686346 RepID=UPI00140BD218|nr:GTPase [Psychromonas sp. SA13A]